MADNRDLEGLYRQDGRRLWHALFAFSGDRDLASDALAEAFAQALRGRQNIRIPAAWIWKAAFHIARGELKRRGSTSDRPPEVAYEMDDDVLSLFQALSRLSANQRAAVVLHYYAGYSLKETASILGSAPATVGVHLSRARRRLRGLLADNEHG